MARAFFIIIILTMAHISSAIAAKKAIIHVSTTVRGECSISTNSFYSGTYERVAGKTGSATVTMNCTKDLNAEVTLSNSSSAAREPANSPPPLSYTLYKDKWLADKTGNTSKLNIVGDGKDNIHVVYSKLELGENFSNHSHSDNIRAIVIFAP